MPLLDPVLNFAKVTVSTGYDDVATSIVLSSGHGALLPQPSTDGAFNLVWWNNSDYPDPSDDPNKEIVRCTVRSTDTLTITRAQESTSASTKNTATKTYKMILSMTKKTKDDIESAQKTTYYKVTQTSHGFSAGNVIRNSGTANTYTKAQADSAANAEVVGIVIEVFDSNNFTYVTEGIITAGVPTNTAGTVYFLDPSTSGTLTATEPSTTGQISKPLLIILESAAKAFFHNYRGMDITASETLPYALSIGGTGATDAATALSNLGGIGAATTNTLTNKRNQDRVYSTTSLSSLTPEIDTYDIFHLTSQGVALTINNPSTSTPADGEQMIIRILDNGTARAISFGTAYVAKGGIALPTTTILSKNMTMGFEYNSSLAKWNLLALAQET